jgi:gamma-glutamylcyclotransferase (GGCT)/AIG2-like uncharacterized protein YtfP
MEDRGLKRPVAIGVDKTRKPQSKKTLLFVYGTLMRGGKLHSALGPLPDVEFVGKAKIQGELYRLRGEKYPGAVRTSEVNRFVHGELYTLSHPDRILERIDRMEGCDEGLFKRQLVDAWMNGKKYKAWTYFYGKSVSNAEPLPDGKFLPAHAGT